MLAHRGLGWSSEQLGQAAVGKALALQVAQLVGIEIVQRSALRHASPRWSTMSSICTRNQGSILVRSNTFSQRHAVAEGLADVPDALGAGVGQFAVRWFLAVGRRSRRGRRR